MIGTFTSKRGFASMLAALLVSGLLLGVGPAMWAHGDDQMLIDALTEELARAPEADLFIRRGELFRHHREWAKAEADYLAAARLDPDLAMVDFFRARALLESGAVEKAHIFIDTFVTRVPDEAEGWFLRAEVLAALGQPEAAAADYAEGIRRAPNPRPGHYLRRAKLLAAAPVSNPMRALDALDDGIARLGPVISLVDYAIALELERNNHEGALVRIAAVMEKAPRREGWLVRQGDILVKCGRMEEAMTSYRAALTAIESLPERYRDTVPVEKLERDARTALSRLSTSRRR